MPQQFIDNPFGFSHYTSNLKRGTLETAERREQRSAQGQIGAGISPVETKKAGRMHRTALSRGLAICLLTAARSRVLVSFEPGRASKQAVSAWFAHQDRYPIQRAWTLATLSGTGSAAER